MKNMFKVLEAKLGTSSNFTVPPVPIFVIPFVSKIFYLIFCHLTKFLCQTVFIFQGVFDLWRAVCDFMNLEFITKKKRQKKNISGTKRSCNLK